MGGGGVWAHMSTRPHTDGPARTYRLFIKATGRLRQALLRFVSAFTVDFREFHCNKRVGKAVFASPSKGFARGPVYYRETLFLR